MFSGTPLQPCLLFFCIFLLVQRIEAQNTFPATGNVGIGTTTPGDPFVVNGKARIISNLTIGADVTAPGFAPLYITGQFATIQLNVSTQPVDQKNWDLIANGNTFRILTESDADDAVGTGMIMSRTGINVTSTSFPTGNLLIGQTTQTNPIYRLDVSGPARANKIVVNTTGADFVFDSAYRLPSLPFVEQYVRRNHHLPDIAPAGEMQKEGLDLGDNQTRLLQKIEELTLYIIAQQKRMDVLEEVNKQIAELRAELDAIKRLVSSSALQGAR